MATQQPQARPWFRLASISRPAAPTTTPPTEPSAPQPRPPLALPTFRPLGQPTPTQNQEPTTGVSSVPSSPTRRTSVPSSPVTKTTQTTTSSVPSSPKRKDSDPSFASVPTSPLHKPAPPSTIHFSPPAPKPSSTSSVPTSPLQKPAPSATIHFSPPAPKPSSTSSLPTSPIKTHPASPVKPVPTSPVKTVSTSSTFRVPTDTRTSINVTPMTARVPSPTPSPRTIKPAAQTPPQSPKHKPTAPPPSPLILPPPQLKSKAELEPKIPVEAEQKVVLVQKTIETPKPRVNGTGSQKDFHESHKPNIAHHQHGKHEEQKDVEAKKKGHHKKSTSDSEEVGMRVITIAGENKGAFMEVIKSPLKKPFDGNSHSPNKKGIKLKNDSDGTEWHSYSSSSSSGEEGNSKKKDKSHKAKTTHSPPMDAYMNSNVQGVNNSILFNSSCSHHDPGLHLSLSRKPLAKGFHVKDSSNGQHS